MTKSKSHTSKTFEKNRKKSKSIAKLCYLEKWEEALALISRTNSVHDVVKYKNRRATESCLLHKNYVVLKALLSKISEIRKNLLLNEVVKLDVFEPVKIVAESLDDPDDITVQMGQLMYQHKPKENSFMGLLEAKADVLHSIKRASLLENAVVNDIGIYWDNRVDKRYIGHIFANAINRIQDGIMETFDAAKTGMIPELVQLSLEYYDVRTYDRLWDKYKYLL